MLISLVNDKREAIAVLCERFDVQRLEIFGSATRDDFGSSRSDLDLIVTFGAMSPGKHRENYFGLLAELEQLFDRPVDLIESSALENPYFIQAIEASRTVLHARDAA